MSKNEKIYNQITKKNVMTIEEAENIIDDMYQDKCKIMSQKTETGVVIDLSNMDEIMLTNLELASVRMLREKQYLKRKYEKMQGKIREILKYYEHTPADDSDSTVAFYADIKKLLEEK